MAAALIHPLTGLPLAPLGMFRGRPVWPILGGNGEGGDGGGGDGGTGGGAGDGDGGAGDLGDPGKQALASERRARKAAEKLAADTATELANLRKSTLTDQERAVEEARTAAVNEATAPLALANARLQVALDKGLTATQAARLVGSTPEELAKDADAFLEEIGGAPQKGPASFNGGTRTPAEKKGGMNDLIRQAAGVS